MALGAARRGELGKSRPAIVLSANQLHTSEPGELLVVVPLSSSSAPSGLRPEVTSEEGPERASRAICRGVRGVARSRLLRRVGEVRAATLEDVERALVAILGLQEVASAL